MSNEDIINKHINNIMSIGNLFKDLEKTISNDMLITKMLCSLPPGYNSIQAASVKMPNKHQTIPNLTIHLLQMEHILLSQVSELDHTLSHKVFFTRSH